jgi:hypothetical protein
MANEGKGKQARPAPRKSGGLGAPLQIDRESSPRFMLISAVLLVLVLAGGFIAYGYYDSVVKPRHRTVLEVDGMKVSYSEMKRRMAFELDRNPNWMRNPEVLPALAYENILRELIVISRAPDDFGVLATNAEVEAQMRIRMGLTDNVDRLRFAERFRLELDRLGLHEEDYRRMVKAEVLERKVRDALREQVADESVQARIEAITVLTEDEALEAIERIQAGEEFADVARDVSLDPGAEETGGEFDFTPQGGFNPAYDDYVFSAEVGELSEPLEGPGGAGFYVVRVLERETRPIEEDQKPALVNTAFEEWLEEARARATVVDNWDDESQFEALLSVLENAPEQPQQPQQPGVPPPDMEVIPPGDDGDAPEGDDEVGGEEPNGADSDDAPADDEPENGG